MKRERTRDSKLAPADIEAARRLEAIWNEKKDALGLTQEKMMEALGVTTQGAVSHYIKGRNALNFKAVMAFAEALHINPLEIRNDLPEFQLARDLMGTGEPVVITIPPKKAASQPARLDQGILDDALEVIRGAAQWEGGMPDISSRTIAIAYALLEDAGERVSPANMVKLVKEFIEKLGNHDVAST